MMPKLGDIHEMWRIELEERLIRLEQEQAILIEFVSKLQAIIPSSPAGGDGNGQL